MPGAASDDSQASGYRRGGWRPIEVIDRPPVVPKESCGQPPSALRRWEGELRYVVAHGSTRVLDLLQVTKDPVRHHQSPALDSQPRG